MLIPFAALSKEDQAKCQQNGWIAYDPQTKSTLRKETECVKTAGPEKYYFYIPGLMLRVIWAQSDQEAIDKANLR